MDSVINLFPGLKSAVNRSLFDLFTSWINDGVKERFDLIRFLEKYTDRSLGWCLIFTSCLIFKNFIIIFVVAIVPHANTTFLALIILFFLAFLQANSIMSPFFLIFST